MKNLNLLLLAFLIPICSCCQIDKKQEISEKNHFDTVNNKNRVKAIELIGKATKLISGLSKPLMKQDSSDIISAIFFIDQSFSFDSTLYNAYVTKCQALCLLEKYSEAINALDIIETFLPNYAEGYSMKGFIYEKIGKLDSANICYKNSIKAYNNNLKTLKGSGKKGAMINKAIIESFLNYEIGLSQINALLEEYPNDPEVIFMKKIWFDDFNRKEFINNH